MREGRQEAKWIAVLKPQDEAKGPLFNCESFVARERNGDPYKRQEGPGQG